MPARFSAQQLPRIIQGGMGAGVSSWRLANAVSSHGQLGVVSGTAIDLLLARRLQDGDLTGDLRRALRQFPVPAMAERIIDAYYMPDGKPSSKPYKSKPMVDHEPSRRLVELMVLANFVEVFLAREGHSGPVGINYLQKIQTPTLPSLYGAMLAGVDVAIVGAGIPRAVPGIMDALARGESVELGFDVVGASPGSNHKLRFDPADFFGGPAPKLDRPLFFPIVSSVLLARTMVKKASGRVDGLIVEGSTAGGHNAPPRGALQLDEHGQPIYGERDAVDLSAIAALDLPFWLAGSQGSPEQLDAALAQGAAGIQVGTLFAFCAESGLSDAFKSTIARQCREGAMEVFTDPIASPTGFPFKVLELGGTASEKSIYEGRTRICDLGYLREAYEKPDGSVAWRCSAEPQEDWLRKGGAIEATEGRKCLCNSLAANIGQSQLRPDGRLEPALVTSGDDVASITQFDDGYGAADVIEFLLRGKLPAD